MADHISLLWPVGKETEAMAYADAADIAYVALSGEVGGHWTRRDMVDRYNQLHMAYFGPGGGEVIPNTPIQEPTALVTLRACAVLNTWYDPAPEEE